MISRGPDDSGYWYSRCNQVGLAHNRLSIIDPCERSNQPMQYMQGRYVMTYNGEIYNYQSLRKDLNKSGYRFHTQSDAEVVMAMYDSCKSRMLDKLRGMFSFAIWDNQENTLFAARDPFGIKPFYYATFADQFVFSSMVKSIANLPDITLTSSAAGWCGFLLNGSVPEPYTVHEQINALPAGHYLEICKNGRLRLQPYFSIYDDYASCMHAAGAAPVNYQAIADSLSESVDRHLVADVPVGLFLSSGIDSNVIAYYAREHQDLVGFTLDFEEFGGQQNESELATESAKQLRINHQVLKFAADDTGELLNAFFYSMDQPSIDGLNVWMISKAVSERGFKAVLSGIGGDEVFAGYPSFADLPKFSKIITLLNSTNLSNLPLDKLSGLLAGFLHPKLSGFFTAAKNSYYRAYQLKRNLYLHHDLGLYFDADFINAGIEELEALAEKNASQLDRIDNPYLKVSALEIDNYMKNQLLRDADWASMTHSLELRVPYIDRKLINVCAKELIKLKSPQKKTIMKKILVGHLPDAIFTKNKTGFETPLGHWLETDPQLQSWRSRDHLRGSQVPWARRWAHEVKSRFLI